MMIQYIPITLAGGNLGERHHYLNSLVNDAYQQKIPFSTIEDLPEQTAIDRLFKIDLASITRNVDYIIRNLKDNDMLFVSRALKCTWLLESKYCDIINPLHLENVLFPHMITTAVYKMKHWIHLHLKDTERYQDFYQYYLSKNFDYAIKFLWKCSNEFIACEVGNILEKITPQHLKLLCEKCSQAVRVYFDNLPNNQVLVSTYLNEQQKYYNSLKCLLKVDPDLYLDITEKYFERHTFNKLSPAATLYIMNNHRQRFNKKPELYTAWLLDIKTLAKCLSNDEIKDVVVKLARAEYLSYWFSYKNVEPLIKSLSLEERSLFKKQIFVNKSFGDGIKEWPYSVPSSPSYVVNNFHKHVFLDTEFYECSPVGLRVQKRNCKKVGGVAMYTKQMMECCDARLSCPIRVKTFLDQLYDRYRFVSFEKTFFELRRQLTAESSSQNREYMMLVLVSKSGGRPEFIDELLKLLINQHKNEPANVRAAIIRSLVKRAAIWRLPESTWLQVTEFGHGLGLDGSDPDAACSEGLHAVLLRNILLTGTCQPAIFAAYIREFSPLVEYKLNGSEKRQVIERLPGLFLAAIEAEPTEALRYLNILLCLLEAYRVRADTCPGVLPAIMKQCHRDQSAIHEILQKVYDARIARKELYRQNFALIQTNESYLNVLRHDSELLETTDKFQELVKNKLCHDGFLKKLAVYFSESNGLAERYRCILESEVLKNPRVELGRSLSLLTGSSFLELLRSLDKEPAASVQRRLAAALRANAHLCRPRFDLDTFGCRAVGVKAIANKVSVCKTVDIKDYLQKLLPWPRAAKLALILAQRNKQEAEIFDSVASTRPTVAIKVALRYMRLCKEDYDPRVWQIIRPLIDQVDLSKPRFENLRTTLVLVNLMPNDIKSDYCAVIFAALQKLPQHWRDNASIVLHGIERELPATNQTFIEETFFKNLMENELTSENLINAAPTDCTNMSLRIIAKYLMLSRSENAQQHRLTTICEPLLNRLKTLLGKVSEKRQAMDIYMYLYNFISALKYSLVFFDTTYVSCLPVFEKILEWMRGVLPVTRYFDIYCTMHLTMLYFKSIRQSIKNNHNIFADKVTKENEGVEIVGTIFAKYLAREISELAGKYFDSIVLLYATNLFKYFSKKFNISESRDRFICALVAGYLEASDDGKCRVLVVKTFLNCGWYLYADSSTTHKKLLELLTKVTDRETKYFLYSNKDSDHIGLPYQPWSASS